MRVVKKILGVMVAMIAGLIFLLIAAYFTMYDSLDDFGEDMQTARRAVRLELFKAGVVTGVSHDDVRYIYEKTCYRKCHGDAAMITAVLSPAGWFQVVERMRVKENVDVSGKEADVIIKYLEETYPTVASGYSYEVRKKIHEAVWRNDVGQADIYTDVIYATPEYFASIGAEHLIAEYDIENYYVFILSFSVHEGEVALMDIDKVAGLRLPSGDIQSAPPWRLRFQTADKHHFEGVVRFEKNNANTDPKRLELVLTGVGGESQRIFRWDMPIKYPDEFGNVAVKAQAG